MNPIYAAALIGVCALVTALLRFAPFVIFSGRKTPDFVLYLGRVLPYAIMGMLVVYCFKAVSFAQFPFGLPEIIAGALVVLLHLYKRNTLLSIGAGTVCYMLLLSCVFLP